MSANLQAVPGPEKLEAQEETIVREAVATMDDWISRLPAESEWRHAFVTARRYLAADVGLPSVSLLRTQQ